MYLNQSSSQTNKIHNKFEKGFREGNKSSTLENTAKLLAKEQSKRPQSAMIKIRLLCTYVMSVTVSIKLSICYFILYTETKDINFTFKLFWTRLGSGKILLYHISYHLWDKC